MPDCKICGKQLSERGIIGHVIFHHKIGWDDYKTDKYKKVTKPSEADTNPSTPPPETVTPVIIQPENPPPENLVTQPSVVTGLTESNLENIANRLYQKFQGNTSKDRSINLPRGVTPIQGLEEVEVVGEKINYKVALSPDVFWRWNVFKGQNKRLADLGRAQMFQGDFAEFLDLATKTLLSTYGMYPTIMTFSGGKMLVEMPVREDEQYE